MIRSLARNVGRVLQTLKEQALADAPAQGSDTE